MFNLKTQASQLRSSNNGVTNLKYDQIVPTRDVTGDQFSAGPITYRFENSGEKWWLPSKSYIRMRCKLTKADGTTPLVVSDDIAPNFGLASQLFQSMDFQIANKVVSRCTDYVAQIDALKKRLHKSKSWMDSIGASTNFWESDFAKRQSVVCSDGLEVTNISAPEYVDIKTRTQLGFDAQGVDKNAVQYDAATGKLEFTVGSAGAALPADISVLYPVGSYFVMLQNAGANYDDVPARVIVSDATSVSVTAGRYGNANILVNSDVEWGRFTYETSSVNQARKTSEFEVIFKPVLGLFDIDSGLPCGDYQLTMNPQTSQNVQLRAIESSQANKATTDFKFQVTSMNFYCATLEGPRITDLSYLLDMKHTRAQAVKIDNKEFGQKNLDISPSTQKVSICYQDLRAGSDTRISSSKFRSYNDAVTTPVENSLNRWFFNYAGVSRPSPDYDGELKDGSDLTTQRYVNSQLESQAYYDVGGTEPIREFHENGSYYHYQTPRDGSDKSTRLTVSQGFSASTDDVKNTNLLVFDHSSQVARIQIQDSRVVSVELEEA